MFVLRSKQIDCVQYPQYCTEIKAGTWIILRGRIETIIHESKATINTEELENLKKMEPNHLLMLQLQQNGISCFVWSYGGCYGPNMF